MKNAALVSAVLALFGCAPDPLAPPPAPAGAGAALEAALQAAGPSGEVPILVHLPAQSDAASLPRGDRLSHTQLLEQRSLVVRTLKESFAAHGPLAQLLQDRGATGVEPLWIAGAVAARATPTLVRELQRTLGRGRIELDRAVQFAPPRAARGAPVPRWNLAAIHAPELWGRGLRGQGVVVANMDTGVDLLHPALRARWRGGAKSWFDPFGNTRKPYDVIGHGTQAMGILAGGGPAGIAIGVAPHARWIAAKIFDDTGASTVSVIHRAFQWLLDPGGKGHAQDAPDVISVSWDLGAVNGCDLTFAPDLRALRAAGIVVVFAAGNSGPQALSSESPANEGGLLSVGAIDARLAIAPFSSRGPSACTGAIYPDLVAPGVDVQTADVSLRGAPSYAVVSGTSFAAPHVAGVAALLLGAFPHAAPAEVEAALRSSATRLGPGDADNVFGNGLVDAQAAWTALAAAVPIEIATRQLHPAAVGRAFHQMVRASGGVEPLRWSVSWGDLPLGLHLHAATGLLAGHPRRAGDFAFAVQVVGAGGASAEVQLGLRVLRER